MNLISSDAAYSLYPIATFENRCTLGMPTSRGSPEAIQKYIKRGWRFYFIPAPNDVAYPSKPPFIPGQARWVADKYTWKIPLDQTGIKERIPLSRTSVPLTFDPVLLNGWKLRLPKGDGYECHYYPLSSTIFRYNYAIPDEHLCLEIRGWATVQGKYCHTQFSKEDWIWCVFLLRDRWILTRRTRFDADLPGFLTAK